MADVEVETVGKVFVSVAVGNVVVASVVVASVVEASVVVVAWETTLDAKRATTNAMKSMARLNDPKWCGISAERVIADVERWNKRGKSQSSIVLKMDGCDGNNECLTRHGVMYWSGFVRPATRMVSPQEMD